MASTAKTSYRRPEGHYREVRPGVWRIWFDVNEGGSPRKQRTKTVYGTEADANHHLRETLSALHTNDYSEPSKVTVGALLDTWLEAYAAQKRASTFHGYESNVRLYLKPEIGHIRLSKLEATDIETAYARIQKRGLSRRTVLYAHRVLHKALQYAVRKKLIKFNPAGRDFMDAPPSPKSEARAMTPDERNAYLEALETPAWRSSPWYAPFKLDYFTGLRRGELLGLKWDAIDLDRGVLSVVRTLERVHHKGLLVGEPKSRSSKRAVSLPSTAVAVLRELQARQAAQRLMAGPAWADEGFLFTRADGHPLDPDSASKAFLRLMRQMSIEGVHLHTVRHTHATLLLENGVHLKVIQSRLGHESIQITADTYAHVSQGLDADAAEVFEQAVGDR